MRETQYSKKRNEYTPLIEKVFDESKQTYGARKISFVLRDMGYHIAPKTVADNMHKNGYDHYTPGVNFSARSKAGKVGIIITKDLSRLGRSTGIRFRSVIVV